jgi:hypothetical protein
MLGKRLLKVESTVMGHLSRLAFVKYLYLPERRQNIGGMVYGRVTAISKLYLKDISKNKSNL